MVTAFPNIAKEQSIAGIADGPSSAHKNGTLTKVVKLYVILRGRLVLNEISRYVSVAAFRG
jgi:hypothetical protein